MRRTQPVKRLLCSVSVCCFFRTVFHAAPDLRLQPSAGSVTGCLSSTQCSGSRVPWGPELMSLANHRSGQVFHRAVLWFAGDVPDQTLGRKPIVGLTLLKSKAGPPLRAVESLTLGEFGFCILSQVPGITCFWWQRAWVCPVVRELQRQLLLDATNKCRVSGLPQTPESESVFFQCQQVVHMYVLVSSAGLEQDKQLPKGQSLFSSIKFCWHTAAPICL